MGNTGFADTEHADSLLGAALSATRNLRDGAFWKLLPEQLLGLGRDLETLSRTVHAAQIHLTGEIDTAGPAAARSCPSTAALLRQAFNISHTDAAARVNTARQVLPREQPSAPDLPAALPLLAAAPAEARDTCEHALVGLAVDADPNFLHRAAQRILERLDPDGDLDPTPPAAKMGLDFGGRNIRTGLTPIKGHLDDHGVEIVKKAIDGLSAPRPQTDGTPDPRTPANRRAHSLVQALRGYLDAGTGPAQGGEQPHLSIIMTWDAITGAIKDAGYDTGGWMTPAQARRFLCDAQLTPIVLGSDSEILDVGRKSRTFPAAIRRAVAARDRGCAWPGCDRPPNWCHAHHIKSWDRDFGATNHHNGALLCPYHHTEIHREEWTIRTHPDGTPEFIPPTRIDPHQQPRRNPLHHFTAGAP